MPRPRIIRRHALRVVQDHRCPLYLLALTGDEILNVADISRVRRSLSGKLEGYQRAEVRKHIQNIVDYLDSDEVLLPNSLVIAFGGKVRFRRSRNARARTGAVEVGTLEIPVTTNGSKKLGWIVDGQQRAIALSRSRRRSLPVPVNAFLADDVQVQRDQFFRVNSTRPLPRGLITELLPEISGTLPPNLAARRLPSTLCDMLNADEQSPFHGLIRRTSTAPGKRGTTVVTDTALVKVIEESLGSPSGCLFPYRNLASGVHDLRMLRAVLVTYWTAVKETFPEAWGLPPGRSRLMHSVGLRAMGKLMDRVMGQINPCGAHSVERVRKELQSLRTYCRWTSGRWDDLGGLRWNELQNVPSHVRGLSRYLQDIHLAGSKGRA